MRILPVNNYNYQSKTQNNKNKNVNFGMFFGTPAEAERLCKSAGFTKVGQRLARFLKELGKEIKTPFGETIAAREFSKEEVTQLRIIAKRAKEANIVMSPKEARSFEMVLKTDPESLKNYFRGFDDLEFSSKDFIDVLEAIIGGAKPVTKKTRAYLIALECSLKTVEWFKQKLSTASFIKQ